MGQNENRATQEDETQNHSENENENENENGENNMSGINGKRIDRAGRVWTEKGGGIVIGQITRTANGWRHDLASNEFPRQCDALHSLNRIHNRHEETTA